MLTRREAKMVAEELFKMMKGQVVEATKEICHRENEEYLTPKQVAQVLGWSEWTVYKRKDDLNCYMRIGKRIYFPKSKLHKVLQSGVL